MEKTTRASVALLLIASVAALLAFSPRQEDPIGKEETSESRAILLWESFALDQPHHARHPALVLGVEDLTSDGIPDIAAVIAEHVRIYAGDGTGSFTLALNAPLTDRVQMDTDPFPHAQPTTGTLQDLDGDLSFEILIGGTLVESSDTERHLLWVLSSNEGEYETTQEIPCSGAPQRLAVTASSNELVQLWLANNDESGQHIQHVRITPGEADSSEIVLSLDHHWYVRRLADFDEDGLPDAWLSHMKHGVQVKLWNRETTSYTDLVVTNARGISSLIRADLRDDAEAAIIGGGTLGLAVLQQPWPVGDDDVVSWDLGLPTRDIQVDDFNSDGFPDIVAIADQGQRILFLAGRGGLRFHTPQTFVPTQPAGWVGNPLIVRDLNGDHTPDVVLTTTHGFRVLMNGGSEPRGETQLAFGGDEVLGVGDVDQDGDMDILTQGVQGIDFLRNRQGVLTLEPDARSLDGQWCLIARVWDKGIVALSEKKETAYRPATTWLTVFEVGGDRLVHHDLGEGVLPVLAVGDFDSDGAADLIGTTGDRLWVKWGGGDVVAYDIGPSLSLVATTPNDLGGQDVLVVSTSEYADVLRVSFTKRKATIADPLIQLASVPLAMGPLQLEGTAQAQPFLIAATFDVAEADGENVAFVSGAEWVSLRGDSATASPLRGFPAGELITPFVPPVIADLDGDGLDELAYTTTLGDVIHVQSPPDGNADSRAIDKSIGPLYAADLDGNGVDELIGSTLGMFPVVWIQWNGGKR